MAERPDERLRRVLVDALNSKLVPSEDDAWEVLSRWDEFATAEHPDERQTAETCPDCGIPREWCKRVSSDPAHCWRWDYERFDEVATERDALAASLAAADEMASAMRDWLATVDASVAAATAEGYGATVLSRHGALTEQRAALARYDRVRADAPSGGETGT